MNSFNGSQPCTDVPIRGGDQCFKARSGKDGTPLDLHVTHVLARSFQQTHRVRQRCALEEADIDVGSEDADVGERCIVYADGRITVVHQFPDVRTAPPHDGKPSPRNGAKIAGLRVEPLTNGRVSFDGSGESQEGGHDVSG